MKGILLAGGSGYSSPTVKAVDQSGTGFTGADLTTSLSSSELQHALKKLINDKLQSDEFHPDAWKPAIIGDPATTASAAFSTGSAAMPIRSAPSVHGRKLLRAPWRFARR